MNISKPKRFTSAIFDKGKGRMMPVQNRLWGANQFGTSPADSTGLKRPPSTTLYARYCEFDHRRL